MANLTMKIVLGETGLSMSLGFGKVLERKKG